MLPVEGTPVITKKHASPSKQEVEKFVVRLPKGMRDRIAEVSRLSRRSMNSEIVARPEDSLGESWNESTPAAQSASPILRAVETAAQSGDQESLLLDAFRRMDEDKRAALLALLR